MKQKDVTIITSVYSATNQFLEKQQKAIDSQKYSGKIKHILINDNIKKEIKIKGAECINHKENKGLVKTLNEGFKLSKTEIVVSLMDDCIPSSKDWLRLLVEPLNEKNVAATTSEVEMPKKFWESFDYLAQALTEKEQRVIIPGLDEKGCAYKKSALVKFKYLNEKEFKNGGEDTDLTIKMQKSNYKIVNTKARIYHYHYFTFMSRMKKEIQYARLSGLISRKYFFDLPWNFKAHVSAKLGILALFILTIVFSKFVVLSSVLLILISQLRLPFQIKKLKKNNKLLLLPLINIALYLTYVVNYTYALVWKPSV